jgi:hypothetical protein
MIVHLATSRGSRSIRKHLWYCPALNRRVVSVAYERLLEVESWQRGVYLFTDSERMTTAQKAYASVLWNRLSEQRGAFVLLNHPTRHLARFRLLRKLFDDGINDFNVHRVEDLDDTVRYPVFLRYEDQHIGSLTPLLGTRAETEDWIAQLAAEGEQMDRVIATEFVETRDHEGLYRKFGAFRIGRKIVPRHMFVGTHWEVKQATNTRAAFRRREEYGYLRENPHADRVLEIFEMADIQYGRIDYALKDGRIQVWEINDNPQCNSSLVRYYKGRFGRNLYSLARMNRAFSTLESAVEQGPPLAIQVSTGVTKEALCVR